MNTPHNSTILVIDPIGSSQAATILGINRKSRYLFHEPNRDVLAQSITQGTRFENLSTMAFCQVPECSEKVQPWCSYNYVLLQYVPDETYIKWLQSQTALQSFKSVYKNEDVEVWKRGDESCT